MLILCTGKFTKRINEYMAQEKEYTGTFTLGRYHAYLRPGKRAALILKIILLLQLNSCRPLPNNSPAR